MRTWPGDTTARPEPNARGATTSVFGLAMAAALLALAMGTTVAWAADREPWIGYRGPNGTCIVPNAKPPLKWGDKAGASPAGHDGAVRWRAAVANWGYSAPVFAKGRVFVLSEAGWRHTFPVIECFDAATGARKWGVELDHIDAVEASAGDRAQARKGWKELVAFYNCAYGVPGIWNKGTVDAQRRAIKLMEAAGIEPPPGPDSFAELGVEELKPSGQVLDWKYMTEHAKPDSGLNKAKGILAKFGWASESWYHSGGNSGCIGQAFPTPLFDNDRLYVCTAFDATFCLDMEGKVLWKTFAPGIGAGDTCSRARSLILYRDPDGKNPDMLINAMSGVARAFDPLTGRLIWRREMKNVYTTMTTPAITRASGKDVVLCSGTDLPCNPVQMHAFLLPEGNELKVDGWHNPGTTMLTKHDEPDVVFFSGGGEHGGWENKGHCKHPTPAAVRFTVEGDTLKANVLWSGVDGGRCQAFVGLLYDRGRLWCNRHILDALTGARVPGTEKPVYEAKERKLLFHFPYLVGDRVYGIHSFTGGDSECFVYEWNTGKLLAENVMTVPPPKSEEKKEQILQCMGRKDWGFFSYSGAYAIGNDCVYLRSPDELVCVGAK